MSIGLMESARKAERDGRGMAMSVAVHATVIGLAWYATAGATAIAVRPPRVVVIPTYRQPETPTTTSTTTRGGGAPSRRVYDPRIPDKIPPVVPGPIVVDEPVVSWDSLVAGPNDMGPGRDAGPPTGATPDGDGIFRTVDVMAEPDPTNPAPDYPSMLRNAGVAGSVSAQFVVDTTGRVVASSIAFAQGDNALFQRSVRRALEAARFRPALVNGRAVRVLMAQAFQFRLQR
ncbi:MAG: energy transducer TonB [Gemmatimonadaceae bacterium]